MITFATLGSTTTIPLTELFDQAGRLAVALAADGVKPGDRIGILAPNRLEWVLLDLAALRMGAVTAGLEPTKFDASPELISRYELAALFADMSRPEPPMNPSVGPTIALKPSGKDRPVMG